MTLLQLPPLAARLPRDRARTRARVRHVLPLVTIAAGVGVLVVMTPGPWAVPAAALLAGALVDRAGARPRDAVTAGLAVGVAVAAVLYLDWRIGVTNWGAAWIAVPLLGAELLGLAQALGFQHSLWPRQTRPVRVVEDPALRPVVMIVTTLDEGPAVLAPTLLGCLLARKRFLDAHPYGRVEIVLANDGEVAGAACSAEVKRLAARLEVRCVTRTIGGGAKAGNVEHARRAVGAVGDALVVVFDADQVPEPEFLLETVPWFADPEIGWVQTGQYYRNRHHPVARWAHDQQMIFYRVLCPVKARHNAAFICGTNVVVRAEALDEIGGLPQESVTEDFAASIRLHPRWRSVFVPGVLATGLGPVDLPSYLRQQRRWAIGTLETGARQAFGLLAPWRVGLDADQRVQYLLACTHYLSGVRDVVFLTAPLVFLVTGIPAVKGADLPGFLGAFLPFLVVSQVAFWHAVWGRTSWRGLVIGFGSFAALVGALGAVLRRRVHSFAVTPKTRTSRGIVGPLLPHLGFLAASGVALAVFLPRRDGFATQISAAWVAINSAFLVAFCGLGLLDVLHARSPEVIDLRDRARWRAERLRLAARTRRQLLGVAGAAAAVVAVGVLAAVVAAPLVGADEAARPFRPTVPAVPGLGVALPTELDRVSEADRFGSATGIPLAIVAHTREISDAFDRRWAEAVAARGATPWVRLLFTGTEWGRAGASLPAIANGVHDGALRRWAGDLRRYGRPVYLTVLGQADRNWVASSAVTNGGIPQDVPRAWARIRRILAEEGARNVALVWFPADPVADTAIRPSDDEIDAVAVAYVNYEGSPWPEPEQALRAVQASHPGKPILVEVSVQGPSEARDAWLAALARAALQVDTTAAVVVLEGGPAEQAPTIDRRPWSLRADPGAMRALVGGLVP